VRAENDGGVEEEENATKPGEIAGQVSGNVR
jgi:hypothetical protein